MSEVWRDEAVVVHGGDCLAVLRTLPDASVDAVVTDPPYGLGFMGKAWDRPGSAARAYKSDDDLAVNPYSRARAEYGGTSYGHEHVAQMRAFGEWCERWATECLRVLKPGGVMLSFGGTRTWHRLACAIEDAGFEIRDSIAWVYGSGFPKSLNVSKALTSLPACECSVASLSGQSGGVVDAGHPTGAVRAGVGAEPGAVPLAGQSADLTVGVGPQVRAATPDGLPDVDPLDVDRDRESLPVVLGSATVAGPTEREQVVGGVGGVKVEPESLRDQVMGEQAVDGLAVGAGPIALDDGGGDVGPTPTLVLPPAATPGGIAGPGQPVAVSDSHAGPGAVDRHVGPATEGFTADSAGVDAIPRALHGDQSTAERAARCEACGGVRGPIPQGLGTALKPAFEPVVVARKPLAGTVSQNVLAHGTGALNVDATRVPMATADRAETEGKNRHADWGSPNGGKDTYGDFTNTPRGSYDGSAGRWPTNLLLSHGEGCVLRGQARVRTGTASPESPGFGGGDVFGDGGPLPPGKGYPAGYADPDGWELVEDWECQAGCPVGLLGAEARFFPTFRYQRKAPGHERPGTTDVDGQRIAHPTVKPLDLMRWLVRLVTPPGGTVLDPFAGSGTTGEACVVEGMRAVLVELEPDYLPLIVARLSKPIAPVLW